MFTLSDLGTQFRHTTLSNGTRVVIFERPGMPVYLRACFLSGSRFDVGGKDGTAHFLEHMLVAGTKKFPSKDKLAAYIEQYGGVFGATTSLDFVNINTGIGDPADLNKAFEVLHEILFESSFDEKTFKNERGSILSELRDHLSSPGNMVWDVAGRLIFQDTPLAKSILGSRDTIEAITKKDVIDFFHNNMTADRMILVASGGGTLEDISERAEQLLIFPSSQKAILDKQLPIIRKRTTDIEQFSGKEQIHMALGFRTVPAHHKDGFALDVIAEALGGGRASVLTKELRYKRGLVYGVSAIQRDFSDAGAFIIKTSCSKGKLQEVLDIISSVLARVGAVGLLEDELVFAKEKIIKSKRMKLQSSASWVNFHTYQQLLSSEPWTLIDYLNNISLVSQNGAKEIAKEYLDTDKWYLALCGDISDNQVRVDL